MLDSDQLIRPLPFCNSTVRGAYIPGKLNMSSHRTAAFLFVLLWIPTKGEEPQVSCVFNESCVLPCSFQSGSDPVIHWLKTPGDVPVHSSYYGQDQLSDQNQTFKGRTSLFVDQISRGNASLLLREVKLQDKGTYKCYTSTVNRDSKKSFINLRVHAPVRAVKLEPVGDELKCSSEDIYPKPELTWSPAETNANTSVSESEKGLYSIFSSVTLSHKPPEEHSCNISTDHSWSSATYRLQRNVGIILGCVVALAVILIAMTIVGLLIYCKRRGKKGHPDNTRGGGGLNLQLVELTPEPNNDTSQREAPDTDAVDQPLQGNSVEAEEDEDS